MDVERALWRVLMYGALPLWLAAGGADWWCHRRTLIEQTSGPRESWLHLALFMQIALPIALMLFFEINAMLMAFFAIGVLSHLATSLWDTSYAQPRRHIAPVEQQVHSFLEMLPLFALTLMAVLHWHALLAPRWELVARAPSLNAWPRGLILLGLSVGLGFILEELSRGYRHSPPLHPSAPPPEARR